MAKFPFLRLREDRIKRILAKMGAVRFQFFFGKITLIIVKNENGNDKMAFMDVVRGAFVC